MNNSEKKNLSVEVVYLTSDEQAIIALNLPENTTLFQAIHLSGLLKRFPEIDLTRNKIGIFGKIVSLETKINDNDRIEIYRPLSIDPKRKRFLKVKGRNR